MKKHLYLFLFFLILPNVLSLNQTMICQKIGYNLTITSEFLECQQFIQLLNNNTINYHYYNNYTNVTYKPVSTIVYNYTVDDNLQNYYNIEEIKSILDEYYNKEIIDELIDNQIKYYEDEIFMRDRALQEAQYKHNLSLLQMKYQIGNTISNSLSEDDIIDLVISLTKDGPGNIASNNPNQNNNNINQNDNSESNFLEDNYFFILILLVLVVLFKDKILKIIASTSNNEPVQAINTIKPNQDLYSINAKAQMMAELEKIKQKQKEIEESQNKDKNSSGVVQWEK